jgi:phosphate transport system substrate-binding protein
VLRTVSGRSKVPLIVLVLGLIATACGGGEDAGGGQGRPALSGNIFVSGSSTVEPITALVAEKFSRENPGVAIKVDGPGTGDGFKLFCNGESDVSDASRPINDSEAQACAAKNIQFVELKVAIDGLSVVTSTQNNAVQCLSFQDLYALLGPESQGFRRWSDANALGKEVGGSGDYPNLDLFITAPGQESGTYDSFREVVLRGTATKRNQKDDPRKDYQASPNDNVIIDGVSGNRGSLGWVGYSYADANKAKVKLLPVEKDEGSGCVPPTPQTIANGSYPISRALYVYVNRAKLDSNPALSPFIDFYLSPEGIASVKEADYVPLDDSALAKTRQTWQEKTTGKAAA